MEGARGARREDMRFCSFLSFFFHTRIIFKSIELFGLSRIAINFVSALSVYFAFRSIVSMLRILKTETAESISSER